MESSTFSEDPVSGWGRIEVERLGGLAGYGMPGARLRSRGHFMAHRLSPADQATLREIFLHPLQASAQARDAFRCSLTRQRDNRQHTVVVAEEAVPESILDCLRDEIVSP